VETARSIRRTLILAIVLALSAHAAAAERGAAAEVALHPVPVYYFWGDGCPYCEMQKRFLDRLAFMHPTMEVLSFEVWYDANNRVLMTEMAAAYGRRVTGVPMTFIGDEAWTGFSEAMGWQMEASIASLARTPGPDPADRLSPDLRGFLAPVPPPAATISLPLLGTLDLSRSPLLTATLLIAFADGFNPCSMWVLALLLGVVVNTRSRRRVLLVGFVFLSITALVYALFIAGLFTVLSFLPYLTSIRIVVAVVALAFALINLKDYLAYKRGVSLTIDDAQKPKLYERIRNVMRQGGSVPATVLATATLALGVTLVELPCTAGLPMIWTGLVADAGVGGSGFAGLLGLYMLVYLLDELVIFGIAVVTLSIGRIEEREGRVLKLVGGTIMLALALAMLFWSHLLDSVTGMLALFGGAIGFSIVVLVVHRLVHPASSPLTRRRGPPRTRRGPAT
jgi:glutaredoxin